MPRPAPPSTPLEWAAGTAAFAVEIALVGTLGVAAHRLADGGLLGWAAGLLTAGALLTVWALWMAPRAPHRLPLAGRLLLGCGLVVVVAALAYAAGMTAWAWWFAAVGLVVTVAAQTMADSPR